MCSSCGGKAAALRVPGGSPNTPLVIGAIDGRPAQPVTLLEDIAPQKAGRYIYVTGDGVQQAIDDGRMVRGYDQKLRRAKQQSTSSKPPFYVQTAKDKWVGFRNKPAADLYAQSIGGVVITREELEAL